MHANDESLVNWQTVMNRHHLSWSWWSADMSWTAQMVTGRCDLSWSGWSANIFTSLHNTAIKIILNRQTVSMVTIHHRSSWSVLIGTIRQQFHPPSNSKQSRVVTICPECDDLPTCRKLTKGDGPSRPVTDHHQFGDPLRIRCIGQPSKLMIN